MFSLSWKFLKKYFEWIIGCKAISHRNPNFWHSCICTPIGQQLAETECTSSGKREYMSQESRPQSPVVPLPRGRWSVPLFHWAWMIVFPLIGEKYFCVLDQNWTYEIDTKRTKCFNFARWINNMVLFKMFKCFEKNGRRNIWEDCFSVIMQLRCNTVNWKIQMVGRHY